MNRENLKMQPFEFLLGQWELHYHIPRSAFHEGGTDTGKGSMTRALDDHFVFFEYTTKTGGAAHGVFGWDDKAGLYRYWWFENSGAFLTASCKFINADALYMQWHDSLLVQTFTKINDDTVRLQMKHPGSDGTYELILEVLLQRG